MLITQGKKMLLKSLNLNWIFFFFFFFFWIVGRIFFFFFLDLLVFSFSRLALSHSSSVQYGFNEAINSPTGPAPPSQTAAIDLLTPPSFPLFTVFF